MITGDGEEYPEADLKNWQFVIESNERELMVWCYRNFRIRGLLGIAGWREGPALVLGREVTVWSK